MTQKIETIALTRINNGAHYNFMNNVAQKAKDEAKVYEKAKALVDALIAAVARENEDLVLTRKNVLSDTISAADGQRDAYYSGYRSGVKSFRAFPAGAEKEAAEKLWQHLTDYGIQPKMQLDRETGLLTNFIEDLEGKFSAEVAQLQLVPFVQGMKLTNEQVRLALLARDAEQAALVLGALKASRSNTDEAYHALVRRLNAYAEIEGQADYRDFIAYVNELIKRFKQEVLPQGKKPSKDDMPDGPGGGK